MHAYLLLLLLLVLLLLLLLPVQLSDVVMKVGHFALSLFSKGNT